MSDRNSFPAGAITFLAASVDWQGSDGSLSGNWANALNWSPSTVPGAADAVVISNAAATNPWTVGATSESAASLLLNMNLGTLEANTALTVGGVLTQALGTLLADAGATITVAALAQTVGAVILNDDGSGTTTLDSAGTDSVDGTVTLVDGAVWTDAALGIGLGTADSTAPVQAAVTLSSGTGDAGLGFATLNVAGALTVGGDPGAGSAGGVGSLEVDNGSIAYVGGLTVENGSTVSVDPLSGIAVGASASSIAEQAAIVIGTGAGVLTDIATLGADVINFGTLAVQPWEVPGLTDPGDLVVTGSLVSGPTLNDGSPSNGVVTVAPLATLNVGGSVEIDSGSLTVGPGGTLEAANSSAANIGVYLAGGALTLDQATLNSFGTADFANSDATLTGGALWTSNTLSIAPGFSDGSTAVAAVSLAGASLLSANNGIDVGNDPGVGSAATSDPGGVGTLDLSGGSAVSSNSMAVLNGSLVSLDASSTVLLDAVTDEAGTVVVGSAGLLVADIATVLGSVSNAGTLDVTADPAGIAGDLLISGSLTGAGGVSVVAGSTLEVGNARGFAGHIVIGGGGELVLDAGDMAHAELSATGGNSSIDVEGQSLDSAAFAPSYNNGQLVFGDAASQSTLEFAPNLAIGDFTWSPDAAGTGTLITEIACFAAGTRIATERGEVPVEALRDRRPRAAGGRRHGAGGVARASPRRLPAAPRGRPTCSRCGWRRTRSGWGGRAATCCCRPTTRCSSTAC